MENLLQLIKKNHTPKVNALCNPGTKFLCLSSEFLHAGSSMQNAKRAIRLVYPT